MVMGRAELECLQNELPPNGVQSCPWICNEVMYMPFQCKFFVHKFRQYIKGKFHVDGLNYSFYLFEHKRVTKYGLQEIKSNSYYWRNP